MLQTAPIAPPNPVPDSQKEYDDQAVFASATDARGVIRYANDAFCEVSEYNAAKLMGAPHKILRHPDMPRGLYHALWEELKRGNPTCVYIKNRAADGRPYWVFSTITPAETGFVSVQIKPQSDLFAFTEEMYADLCVAEAGGMLAERSADLMYEKLAEKGYADFGTYMQAVLDAEIALREEVASIAGPKLDRIADLNQLIERAQTLTDQIAAAFQQVRGEPVNLRILAGRMEDAGAAISTISKNYETMATDMYQSVKRLNGADSGILANMRASIDRGRCAGQIAALMQMAQQSDDAQISAVRDTDVSLSTLAEQSAALERACRAAMLEIAGCGRTIPDICRQLRRRIKGLDMVKLLCRVESGRMGDSDNGLNGIISRLEEAHQSKDNYLSELSGIASQINSRSRDL